MNQVNVGPAILDLTGNEIATMDFQAIFTTL